MPIVRNRDNGLLYDFDPASDEVARIGPEKVRPSAIVGYMGRVGPSDAILWSDGRELTLRLEGRDFEIEPLLAIEALATGGIRIVRDGLELARVPYRINLPANEPPSRDFGIFLVEALANAQFRESFLRPHPRDFLLRRNNLLEETLAIVAEFQPDHLDRMRDEITRWCWRWDPTETEVFPFGLTRCRFCGLKHMTDPERLCGPCTDITRRMVRQLVEGTEPDTALILSNAKRAVLAARVAHSDVLASELERRAARATPAILPEGAECQSCRQSVHRVLRGVETSLCTACVIRRGARPD